MDEFNFWYFLLYMVPESIIIYLVVLRALNLDFKLDKLLVASFITAIIIAVSRYFILGYHTLIFLISILLFVRFYFYSYNIIKTFLSVLFISVVFLSISELYMLIYGVLIPNFSMEYILKSSLPIRLCIAYPILITFFLIFKFIPTTLTKRNDHS